MSTIATEELLGRLKADNKQAMKLIFQEHYSMVCQVVYRYIKDRDTVEDVAQDVFIKLWEKRQQINITSSFGAYLRRMAMNESISFLRKHKKHEHDEVDANTGGNDSSSEQLFLDGELSDNIMAAIDRLPPRCRMIFQLSRFEELTYKEIAAKLDISVKTVENQMGKALKLLREWLQDYLA